MRYRHRFRGVTYQVLGWVMLLGCIPFMVVISPRNQAIAMVGGVAMFAGAAVFLRKGLKHDARTGEEILSHDDRPPIVYLRSFSGESDDYRVSAFLRGAFGVRISQDVPAWPSQEQFLLGKYLSKIGPYVAIGRPGESLPELGASRMYVGEEWRQKVVELLRRARLVILRAGHTQGVHWEIERILSSVRPAQTLVILPLSQRDYARFRQSAPAPFNRLPEAQPIERLVMFDERWTPLLLPDRKSIEETLRPFLERNGIDPPRQSIVWKAAL